MVLAFVIRIRVEDKELENKKNRLREWYSNNRL
jgi:hypothetical protein